MTPNSQLLSDLEQGRWTLPGRTPDAPQVALALHDAGEVVCADISELPHMEGNIRQASLYLQRYAEDESPDPGPGEDQQRGVQ